MAKCQCGCGDEVSIAKRSNSTLGHVKGQPVRFIPGHHRRGAYSPLTERFHQRVAHRGPDECWLWTGARVPAGYGSIYRGNERLGAHRLAWEIANDRTIPKGMFICHRCDNPPCCNPAHLFIGTKEDNDADRDRKGRTLTGERKPDAKLTDAAVRDMRQRFATGARPTDLAAEYGVTCTTACQAIHRQTWKHVT